jgi:hypothetical protein
LLRGEGEVHNGSTSFEHIGERARNKDGETGKIHKLTFPPSLGYTLTYGTGIPRLEDMEVHFPPEVEEQLARLADSTGQGADELVQDVMAGYLAELAEVRTNLDRRYDEIKSGKVLPIDGESFFESLRKREEELLKSHRTR